MSQILEREQAYRPPRSTRTLMLLIDSQRKIIADLLDVAVDFNARDFRPLIHDGVSVQRIGPDPVPLQLREAIGREQLTLAELQHELYRAHEMEKP